MIGLLVMTDGRLDCLERTIESAEENLNGDISFRMIHDDTGDIDYRARLQGLFPDYVVVGAARRLGFGGAIANAWRLMRLQEVNYIFHLEDDFIFNETIDLGSLGNVLEQQPHLVQLALKRQPWSDSEMAVGGFMAADRAAFTDVRRNGNSWVEHEKFFTTNPSLYRKSLVELGWPEGENSEGLFGFKVRDNNPLARFGYWGSVDDEPLVHHIGKNRVGVNY